MTTLLCTHTISFINVNIVVDVSIKREWGPIHGFCHSVDNMYCIEAMNYVRGMHDFKILCPFLFKVWTFTCVRETKDSPIKPPFSSQKYNNYN